MLKITLKIIFLSVLVFVTCAAILKSPTRYNHALSQIILKKEILAKTPSRKIVFVGGSNLLAGLDSRLVQEKLKYNVVNMGLYQGFGISFLLDQARNYLNSGDVVVIVPEYTLLLTDGWFWPFDEHAIKWSLALAPGDALEKIYLKRARWDLLMKSFSELSRDKLQALEHILLSKGRMTDFFGYGYLPGYALINEYGDARSYTEKRVPLEKMEWYGHRYPKTVSDPTKINELNEFEAFCRSRNVKVYFMFSVYPLELVNENRDAFTNAYAELRRNLHFPVLGTPDDFAYSRDYFTDTPNHISSSGKQIRTARVIELLASQLGSSHGSAAAGK